MASESMAESDKRSPALEWLRNTSQHMLWKGDRAAIARHLEEQQKAGASEIWAVDLAKEEGHEICASFVLVLPQGAARAKLISLHNEFWKTYLGSEASAEDLKEFTIADEGQKYIFYNFDL
jgi:hypothetical protein